MTKQGFFKKYEFTYDEFYDCVICPNDKILNYCITNKDGNKEFKSDPKECKACPFIHKCTQSKEFQKTYTMHVWHEYLDNLNDVRFALKYDGLYKQRKETIERVFADAKEKHAMRFTQYRGLARVTKWVRLKFACMNLKKLAIHKWKDPNGSCVFQCFFDVFTILQKRTAYS